MRNDYTTQIKRQFISPTTLKLARTAEELMCMPLDTDARTWQKKLEDIAQEFRLSCRFCLMRIFQSRADVRNQCTENGFWLKAGDKKFEFWDIDMHHAESMRDHESEKYLAYMRALARMQNHPEKLETLDIPEKKVKTRTYENRLIAKAWAHRTVGKAEYVLSRKEAFRLGHMLNFEREEMTFFLLRVFDYEEGFRFDTSNDLIEAYGLQKQKTWLEVEALKRDYAACTADIVKEERPDRNNDWTAYNASIPMDAFKSDEEFLDWLKERASGLDTGSRTARRLYRNLAAYCWRLGQENAPVTSELGDTMIAQSLLEEKKESELAQQLIFEDGVPNEKKCSKFARKLRRINYGMTNMDRVYKDAAKSSQKSWHVPTLTNKNSKLSVSGGPINLSMRVDQLLYGSKQVEKSDMLFLLWVIANQTWSKVAMNHDDIAQRIQSFIEICENCLERAMLPPFYIPHLLEQTMLLAIVHNGTESYSSQPAKEYEKMLNLEKDIQLEESDKSGKSGIRDKEAGYHRHTDEEWLEFVILSRKRLEYTKKEFAKWQGVSVQSLDHYQSKFVKEGTLKPFNRKKQVKKYQEKLERNGQLEAVMEEKRKTLENAAREKEEDLLKWREMRTKYDEK